MAKIPYTIYKITNLVNGKVYIGQTRIKLIKRWCDHKTSKVGCTALIRAIKKHGKKSFKCEAIFSVLKEKDLNFYEIYFINYYKSFGKNGYNLNLGGHSLPSNKLKKQIVGYNIRTGETHVFDRYSACKKFGYDTRTIKRCIDEEKYIHKGCLWFLKENFNEENVQAAKTRYYNGLLYDRKNPYQGVVTYGNNYVPFITINDKNKYLGTFKDKNKALSVYQKAFAEVFNRKNPFF